ncbi:universal stress protein [Thalassobellus suaedae]|uniref:Universal stress protein n=1 Tax=Thalassobellus suaedae TaxID=3074124 RepID=A0ABY9Y585_9FLAO|nr:universal stress protein [Flavobacteriaceae bacterium HL-DH10]
MKNILIPTDFSENAWNAIEYALRFFSKSTCNFYLLHVNTSDVLTCHEDTPVFDDNTVSSVLKNSSKKHLQQTIKRINKRPQLNPKHRFYTILDNNFIINSIRKQVAEKKIDYIVMGTRGASGINKLPIGSNTGNVITKVKCTTLVVPENAKYVTMKEIAFPTDFSFFYPAETLQPMTDIVESCYAAVRVLNIKRNGVELNEDQQKNKAFLDDYFNNNEHSFHFLTQSHIEGAIQEFVKSRDVNLIAMLAKNLNYFQKILFHPKVPKISYYTDIPFLVLH